MPDLLPPNPEPCSNCPFRKEGGIRTPPETGAHLLASARRDVTQHRCHQTVCSETPRQCAGATLFCRDGHPDLFPTARDFLAAQTRGT